MADIDTTTLEGVKTSRRGFFGHAAGAYVALGALTVGALAGDPIFDAIREWKAASAAFWAMDDCPDDQVNAACDADSAAALRMLTTVPTTMEGFRAFCELGIEMSLAERSRDSSLADWRPGYRHPGALADAEALYLTTLAKAAQSLIPASA